MGYYSYAFVFIMNISDQIHKGSDNKWHKKCPTCNVDQSYSRFSHAVSSFKLNKECKKCSNSRPENCSHKGWINGVLRRSFIKKYLVSAELREIEWAVTFEFLADLLINQEMKCALTGWDISAMEVQKNTASLDRIDSTKGYVEGNVQWVHKMVNMCKQHYCQEDFIDMCEAIIKTKSSSKKWVKGS